MTERRKRKQSKKERWSNVSVAWRERLHESETGKKRRKRRMNKRRRLKKKGWWEPRGNDDERMPAIHVGEREESQCGCPECGRCFGCFLVCVHVSFLVSSFWLQGCCDLSSLSSFSSSAPSSSSSLLAFQFKSLLVLFTVMMQKKTEWEEQEDAEEPREEDSDERSQQCCTERRKKHGHKQEKQRTWRSERRGQHSRKRSTVRWFFLLSVILMTWNVLFYVDPSLCPTIWGGFADENQCLPSGMAFEKIGTIQRRLAWPLHKDDAQTLRTPMTFF